MGAWKLPTGKYLADFRDAAGKRRYKTFDTKKAADAWSAEQKRSVRRGEYQPPETIPTFKETADQWMLGKMDRRPGTTEQWQTHLDRHLLPTLGDLRLNQINVATVETLRDDLRKRLGARTVCAVIRTAAAVFKLAIRRGVVSVNPAALAERPFLGSKELTGSDTGDDRGEGLRALRPEEVLAPEEIGRLLDAATPGLHRTVLMMAAFTGMRSGELFALQWGDIEFEPPRVMVRRTLSWATIKGEPKKARFFPPKTISGARTIPLVPELVAALRRWKLECPVSELGLVFPTTTGTPMWRGNVLRRGFWPALNRARLRHVSMHSLRHSFASTLIAQNVPITQVQSLCGHSNPGVTLRIYSHWLKGAQTDSLAGLSAAILGERILKPTGT